MSAPTFTRHDDGSVTVNEAFPDDLMVTPEFLRFAHPSFVWRVGFRSFTIAVSNGGATYRILSKDWSAHAYVCRRVP